MKTPRVRLRITAYHRVEASPGPLDPVPGGAGRPVLGREPRLDQLPLGRDLTAFGVDEEHAHDFRA